MDTEEIDRNAGQRDGNANQRVDSVTVERNCHQENSTQTKHHRVQ